jgi:Protein of unknown function (DUF3631)
MTTTDLDTTLAAIDHAVGCQKCGQSLAESPSGDFCSETCQAAWLAEQTAPEPVDSGQRPDQDLAETAPSRPLGWLAPTPRELRPGHEVLDDVTAFVSRYSVFPHEHCAPTLTLWYAHTHAADRFYITPRLILDSAEPGSGKTRVLEVAQLLVAAPEMTMSATPAALFRLVAAGPITILFDEVDAIFNPKNGGNEDLRALLNAGYKQGATVARCAGDAKNMVVQRFPVFAPAALAGIAGGMPDTITTRAVTIHMRRKRSDQTVGQFRLRTAARAARPIREALAYWVNSVAEQIGDAMPEMPEGVTDRAAEVWEPLLAVADAAGGHWPDTARAACTHFVLNTGPGVRSIGVRLLADLRTVFAHHNTDRLPTTAILADLHAMDEAAWADLGGKPLDARRLAKELGRYGVRVVPFKHDPTELDPTAPDRKVTVKGYVTYATDKPDQLGLADAWSRYLPAEQPGPVGNSGNHGNPAGQPVTDPNPVTDPSVTATPTTATPDDPPTLPGYRSIGNRPPIGNHLTREVTDVTEVTDTREETRP